MKTQKSKLLLASIGLLSLILGLNAFFQPVVPPTEDNPPLVERIFVQKLKEPLPNSGANVLLLAQFSPNDPSLKEQRSLKLNLGDDSVRTLFDDGTNGDSKAGDGLFSAPLLLAEEEIINLAKRNNASIERLKGEEMFFVNRQKRTRKLQVFDEQGFRALRPVPLDLVMLSVVTGASLPNIQEKSLIVRDLTVVNDLTRTYDPCRTPNKGNSNGVWSFGRLIANMANTPLTGVSAKDFLVNWVNLFLFNAHTHPVSGDATSNRNVSKERLVKAWMKNSGLAVPIGPLPANWHTLALKPEEFPVRLLAIVNRLDLRGNSGYGFSNAGEGRLVFCFVDSNNNCATGNNGPGTMTFIFEYAVPLRTCSAVRDYGKKWWDLQSMTFGPAYNAALESLTNVFTSSGAMPNRPNGSALNHLRTNDFIQSPWDIRDFLIDANTKMLKIVHPNREPMKASNGPTVSALNNNLVTFTNGTLPPNYTIPNNLAGMEAVMPSFTHHWRGSVSAVMTNTNRQFMSFNSCSGCHTGETKNRFTHIRPRASNAVAALSGFMTGLGTDDNTTDGLDNDPMGSFWVNDPGPVPKLPQAPFNEALRRALDLEALKNRICPPPFVPTRPDPIDILFAMDHTLRFRPVNMEH